MGVPTAIGRYRSATDGAAIRIERLRAEMNRTGN